jgi:hypothetical protein
MKKIKSRGFLTQANRVHRAALKLFKAFNMRKRGFESRWRDYGV